MNKEAFEIPVAGSAPKAPRTLWDRIESMGQLDQAAISRNLYFILFLAGLALLHIANNHYAENTIRRINSMEKQIKELRWTYMSAKSDLMRQSMQSEVARKVEPLGLEELKTPPYKIEIDPKSHE